MKQRQCAAMALVGLLLAAGLMGCPPPNTFHSLVLNVSPPGSGYIVATPSQVEYRTGTEVTLEAVAHPGWEFSNWEGNVLNGSVAATRIGFTQDESVTAVFVLGGGGAGNVVQDPGFEGGPNSAFWTQSSLNFDTVICDEGRCGGAGGLAAHTGRFWVYFGGTPTGAAETASVAQEVTLPVDEQAALQFYLACPAAEAPFTFQVFLGPTVLFEATEADQGLYRSYRRVSLDASRYADAGIHTLRFSYSSPDSPGPAAAVFLDDVSLTPGVEADAGDGDYVTIANGPVLPDATEGEPYLFTLDATGGSPPYLWTVTGEGLLPPGITLTSGGTLRGTPEDEGSYTFRVRATDTREQSHEASFALTVSGAAQGALAITSGPVLPSATVGQSYDFTFGATGGDAPYVWSLIGAQTLPAGLTFTSGGTLNGTPVAAGVYTFQAQVSDTNGDTENDFFTLAVVPRDAEGPIAINSGPVLPEGQAGAEYSFTFSANGGTPPYIWSLAPGATLPAGLTLDENGNISGTPSSAGTYTFQVNVVDNEGETAGKFFALTVQA